MGEIRIPRPVKLFSSVLYTDTEALEDALEALRGIAGQVQEMTAVMSFDHTRYYTDEMGDAIRRRFLLFEPMMERARGRRAGARHAR